MRLLVDAGADIKARNVTEPRVVVPEGASQRAAGFGRRRGSQVPSAFAVPNQTALHGAAGRGFTAFVKFLAENGADLEAKDANGRTALDLARGGVNLGGFGAPPPEPFPETAELLESLMAAQGVPLSSPE